MELCWGVTGIGEDLILVVLMGGDFDVGWGNSVL